MWGNLTSHFRWLSEMSCPCFMATPEPAQGMPELSLDRTPVRGLDELQGQRRDQNPAEALDPARAQCPEGAMVAGLSSSERI
jgi:hypothetical protein